MAESNSNAPKITAMAPWDDAAGVSFVPRASNTLSCYGQIPHNFPVMDPYPKIEVDPWLPEFVHKIIADAKRSTN